MIPNYRTSEGRAPGWQVANWARTHAATLGVHYLIFGMRIWNVDRDSQGWPPYTRYGQTASETLSHRDHLHISATGKPAKDRLPNAVATQ